MGLLGMVDLCRMAASALEMATTQAMGPELMLLDEPTQGMQHEDVARVTELIKRVSVGRTILMVEHNKSVVAGFALIVRIIHSPFRQVLKAIKKNEPCAILLGLDVDRYKRLAFVLSVGLAGATKTLVLGFETLTDVHWSMSGLVILMTLVGGMGTKIGLVIGILIIIALENKLGDLGTWLAKISGVAWFSTVGESVTIVTGFIFIVCMLLFRRVTQPHRQRGFNGACHWLLTH
jgi:ABC-type branched-subunit amino acid transport system permease subunit